MPAPHEIASAFLPNRYHYYYTRSKLGSDPLYGGVADALRGTTAPLLDLGCGLGLLAHTLNGDGIHLDYVGVDNDVEKIDGARIAAARAGLHRARFDVVDLSTRFPAHSGSVAILDVLQFLTPDRRFRLLGHAAACLHDDARLVIRTGMADGNWRRHVTLAGDLFARWVRWMNAAPKTYPTRAGLVAELESLGLRVVDCSPLWGRTPFNNWLLAATRADDRTSGTGSTVE